MNRPPSPLVLAALAVSTAGAAVSPEPAAAVSPFPATLLAAKPRGERARVLMQGYYESIRDWGDVLRQRFQVVPGRPDCGYYGEGGHRENDVRPITYAAFANAFLAEAQPPEGAPSDAERARMRREAVAALRYLAQAHVTGGGACLDGKPWGDQWQSAMWARAAGLAAWLLWPHLDDELKTSAARLVEHEADRFVRQPPKSREFRNTGAEENAWNAGIVALACAMMPRHPRSKAWDEAAKRYLYNSLSVAADAKDDSPGDDGRPVRDWVTTVNAHPDFTVENHGLVHVGYLKTTLGLMLKNAPSYLAAERPVPRACLHHVGEGFGVMLACMSWEGAPVYFGGNDWKDVHTQATDVIVYAMLSLLAGDRRAAHLEDVALDWLRRIQHHEGGFYSVRRDIEFGGVCATRLILCYLAHAALGAGAEPLSDADFDRAVSGVRLLPHGKAILHRTPTKFASFTWGPKRLALAIPRGGSQPVWPHYASCLGLLDGQDASERNAKLVELRHDVRADRFSVVGTLKRLGGKVTHDFALVSLPQDTVVYVERLRLEEGSRLKSRETGIVGHEYPIGSNTRELRGAFGSRQVTGLGGEAAVHELETGWLSLGGPRPLRADGSLPPRQTADRAAADTAPTGRRLGYVVRRLPGRPNVMRYHDLAKGSGRVPKLQEWLSLIGDREPVAWATDWACLVTFLNQPADETARQAGRVAFAVDGDVATCRIGEDMVRVDFAARRAHVEERAAP